MSLEAHRVYKNGWYVQADRCGIRFGYEDTGTSDDHCLVLDVYMAENLYYKANVIANFMEICTERKRDDYSTRTLVIGRDPATTTRKDLVLKHHRGELFVMGFSDTAMLSGPDCFGITLDIDAVEAIVAAARKIGRRQANWHLSKEVHWGVLGEIYLPNDTGKPSRQNPVSFSLTEDWIRLVDASGCVSEIVFEDCNLWDAIFDEFDVIADADQVTISETLDDVKHSALRNYQIEALGGIFTVTASAVADDGVRVAKLSGPVDLFDHLDNILSRHWAAKRSLSGEYEEYEDEYLDLDDEDEGTPT